ncbi:hypothetical protein PHLGIDRAFT_127839 [Phlebiopsis gigantea 11061_1 CR5-6]|uniref:BTB domain-containing protein n=1 Tax=Phlebiopsis gigantea (strain 11061_1 CR5-6) TaxID=745531 RepID=A0A0C3NPR3_PHLG1|nr:hypothetical protein PHLGIDRAFT_127839 [Phlebiopsis gigantea 11061_1 CR5-6]
MPDAFGRALTIIRVLASFRATDSNATPTPDNVPLTQHLFNSPSADVILRSSDNVDFRAHKIILAEASSILEAIFSLPQPTSATSASVSTPNSDANYLIEEGLPIVPFPENSRTLNALLGILYPGKGARDMDISLAADVLVAADKYSFLGVVTQMEVILSQSRLIEENPMRLYALARRYDMPELAKKSAKETLLHPFPGPHIAEFKDVPATALYDLFTYRNKCIQLLETLLVNPSANVWETDQCPIPRYGFRAYYNQGFTMQCGNNGHVRTVEINDFLHLVKREYALRVSGSTLKSSSLWDSCISRLYSCAFCMSTIAPQLLEFNDRLAAILDAQISQASLLSGHHRVTH